ncbi:DUF2871 family protein [Nocardia tengchongensis]|uniref:DUF2871 family protein n=1 Tax=Nocardia tengchongensis TaxID=2055889 RepID=UPI0036AB8C1E
MPPATHSGASPRVLLPRIRQGPGLSGSSQLTATHTHVLALGTLFFLIVIVLDKQFALTSGRRFNAFFWTYNAGLVMTVAMMVAHGILTVLAGAGRR